MALQTAPPRYPELKKHLNLIPAEGRSLHVDVSLVDDPAIHDLNRDFRHKDKPTDVLSFPQWEGEVFAFPFPGELEDEAEDLEVTLGDMVISIETAARQAGELRHSIQQEMAFLTIHGVLHLLGYDHQTDSQRKTMWRWQEDIFEKWKEQAGVK
jgi:probable rRNA maturation factor